jgi:hypothetical protein
MVMREIVPDVPRKHQPAQSCSRAIPQIKFLLTEFGLSTTLIWMNRAENAASNGMSIDAAGVSHHKPTIKEDVAAGSLSATLMAD